MVWREDVSLLAEDANRVFGGPSEAPRRGQWLFEHADDVSYRQVFAWLAWDRSFLIGTAA